MRAHFNRKQIQRDHEDPECLLRRERLPIKNGIRREGEK